MEANALADLYQRAHNLMWSSDGLQPQEALDELLKYLFLKQQQETEDTGGNSTFPFQSLENSPSADEHDARKLRDAFAEYTERSATWLTAIWPESDFRLTDPTLTALHELLNTLVLKDIAIDVLSAATRQLISPELRKGLGIFLTPDDVAKMMVEFVDPGDEDQVLDPACGSGTFLKEILARKGKALHQTSKSNLWAIDKNPRMLLMTQLNLSPVSNSIHCLQLDSLTDIDDSSVRLGWPRFGTFDVIFTNPPFGVNLDGRNPKLSSFRCNFARRIGTTGRVPSEVLFIEQCLNFLKPGWHAGNRTSQERINEPHAVGSSEGTRAIGIHICGCFPTTRDLRGYRHKCYRLCPFYQKVRNRGE